MQEIRIQGRTYQVERHRTGQYAILHGARGARYIVLASLRRPGMFYLCNGRDWTMAAPKCWLTDKRGKLEVA
jgi:hypothetical protein